MERFQQQQQQQQQNRQAVQTQDDSGNTSNYICPNCGASVDFHNELCPYCHHPLHPETCSFCGAQMEPEDQYCCECGNPRSGLTCPMCGTLNFRSFCSRCNTPLDDLARTEMEKAKNDPVYQKTMQLAEQMAELEEEIMAAEKAGREGVDDFEEEDDEPDFETVMELSEEDRKLMERYHQLLGTTPTTPQSAPQATPQQHVAPKKKIDKKARVGGIDVAAKKALYQQQLREMQALLNAMQPDVNATPQMQRNYCCAHKVVVTTKRLVRKPTVWVCKAYGCKHNSPDECCEPFKGGHWEYNSYTETTRTIETR